MLEVFLSLMICVCLIYISIVDSIFFSILISGIISFCFILFYLIFKAPDIALTEISIGSSISTLLFIMALLLIKNQKINKNYVNVDKIKNLEQKILFLILSFFAFYFLNDILMEIPFHKKENTQLDNIGELYILKAQEIFQIPSIVTSIIVGFRALDTMFETLLIITSSYVFLKIMKNKEF